jgi:hypothetical protein
MFFIIFELTIPALKMPQTQDLQNNSVHNENYQGERNASSTNLVLGYINQSSCKWGHLDDLSLFEVLFMRKS